MNQRELTQHLASNRHQCELTERLERARRNQQRWTEAVEAARHAPPTAPKSYWWPAILP